MKITTNTMKGFDKGGSRSALCSSHPFQRKNNNRAFQRMTAWAGIIAPILFTFLVAVESLLRQGYSQICNYVSELGVGSYAIIQNTNFIIFGLLSILFVLIYTLGTAYHGATERAFIAVPLIWLAITGTKLESIAKIKQTQELTLRKATEKLSDINEEKESEGPQATALGIDHSPEEVEKMKMHMNMNIDVAFTSLHQICTKRLI